MLSNEDVALAKPDPEIYIAAMTRLGGLSGTYVDRRRQ